MKASNTGSAFTSRSRSDLAKDNPAPVRTRGSATRRRRRNSSVSWARSFPPRSPQRKRPHCSTASSVLLPRPTPHPRTCSSFGFCLHEPVRHAPPDTDEVSQVPHKELHHVRKAFDCARFCPCKPIRHGRCCLLVRELDRHLGIRPVSQLNTRPVVSPVNASRLSSRTEPRASLGVGVVG
jgi:hypothetical protein